MGAWMAMGPCGCTAVTVEPVDTECDYSLEQTLAADERGDEDRESTEELPGR